MFLGVFVPCQEFFVLFYVCYVSVLIPLQVLTIFVNRLSLVQIPDLADWTGFLTKYWEFDLYKECWLAQPAVFSYTPASPVRVSQSEWPTGIRNEKVWRKDKQTHIRTFWPIERHGSEGRFLKKLNMLIFFVWLRKKKMLYNARLLFFIYWYERN